jgi:hypothetical protein
MKSVSVIPRLLVILSAFLADLADAAASRQLAVWRDRSIIRLVSHHWVICCAGAYVSGAAGSNECPAGSVRIETEAACRTAAAASGKRVDSDYFVGNLSSYPRGCFYGTGNNVAYFNTHTVGAGYSTQLLCAASTTGALPPMRAAARRA